MSGADAQIQRHASRTRAQGRHRRAHDRGRRRRPRAANIPAARAREHIFGYAIFNDFSARDAQWVEMEARLGPAKGKSFDGGNVLGPWIVTPDEIGDPYRLKMEARVNGEVRSQGTTEGMLFSFEEIIATYPGTRP
jgi:2-keto-4-pentenoate hydratase/2-oxohepta-3-ene-1,7-dioic acid hydratase in catechol pathway